jgi:hypothetical protein
MVDYVSPWVPMTVEDQKRMIEVKKITLVRKAVVTNG